MILTERPKSPPRSLPAVLWDGSAAALVEIRKLADRPEILLVSLHVSGRPVPEGSYVVREPNGALKVLSRSEVIEQFTLTE